MDGLHTKMLPLQAPVGTNRPARPDWLARRILHLSTRLGVENGTVVITGVVVGIALLMALVIGHGVYAALGGGANGLTATILLTTILTATPIGLVLARTIAVVARQDQELRRSERQMRSAQEIAKLGHWRLDIATGAVQWAEVCYGMLGARPGEVEPTLEAVFRCMHPEDAPAAMAAIQRVIGTRSMEETTYRLCGLDGVTRVIRTDGRCELDREGRVVAVLGMAQDISAQHATEDELRRARDDAERANRAKTAFLATMSHELRTPLNAIIGFGDLIANRMGGPIDDRYVSYAVDIRSSGERLLTLINRLLDVALIESGRREVADEVVDLAESLRSAVALARTGLKPEQRIDLTGAATPLPVKADPRAIRQILLNLLDNAVKYSPPCGTVMVGLAACGAGIAIQVSDQGPGIPPDRLPDLGKPFERAEQTFARSHDGAGLGLYISRSLAEMHGGRLELDSTLGQGTTVTVRLPAERVLVV